MDSEFKYYFREVDDGILVEASNHALIFSSKGPTKEQALKTLEKSLQHDMGLYFDVQHLPDQKCFRAVKRLT